MKYTPWFSVSTPPVHVGVYQTKMGATGDIIRRLWDGECWRYMSGDQHPCMFFAAYDGAMDFWRGLAEKPE